MSRFIMVQQLQRWEEVAGGDGGGGGVLLERPLSNHSIHRESLKKRSISKLLACTERPHAAHGDLNVEAMEPSFDQLLLEECGKEVKLASPCNPAYTIDRHVAMELSSQHQPQLSETCDEGVELAPLCNQTTEGGNEELIKERKIDGGQQPSETINVAKYDDRAMDENQQRQEEAQEETAQLQQKKQLDVLKVECECCGMSEECTLGYMERVRGDFCGHLLCGLCAEAVHEERHRLGGPSGAPMEAALRAHMQPCRQFRAQSKRAPPPDVAVPHAVCRLLRRHLSTPSPRPARRPPSLSRSSSCLPSLDTTEAAHHPTA